MEEVRFLPGNKRTASLAKKVKDLIEAESEAGNLLAKQISELKTEIKKGNALIAIVDGEVIGYGSLGFWTGLVEIRSIVVKPKYRKQGIGTQMIKEIIALARRKYPDFQVIAIAGPMSRNIFARQGMAATPKCCLPKQLWEICPGCPDFDKFPACHCTPLILKEKQIDFRLEFLNAESPYLDEVAQVYCEVWKEPPWNEDFWQIEEVIADIKKQLALPWARGLIALVRGKVVSFTWGYGVDKESLAAIAGHRKLNRLFNQGRKVFYVDELGTARHCRQRGIAERISAELLSFAEIAGFDLVVLRTDIHARAARSLYKKLGFKEMSIFDQKYPDRSYWALKLKWEKRTFSH